MKKWDLFMVFDVEAIGLHGEGFAVGWVVVDRAGTELDACRVSCHPDRAGGNIVGRRWVQLNCPPLLKQLATKDIPADVRTSFWLAWQSWRAKGAVLAADVPWPVESRFLAQCVDDAPHRGDGDDNPYPLIDVASVRLAAGLDPLAVEPRRPGELPKHDPVADARQSARLLILALKSMEL